MDKTYFSPFMVKLFLLTLSFMASAKENQLLFLLDSDVKSSQEVGFTKVNSISEWDIQFTADLLRADQNHISFLLPQHDEKITVTQTHFQVYQSGSIQWAGKVFSKSGEETGDFLINIINGNPYGMINVDKSNYEIYTDSKHGSRLAKMKSESFLKNDTQVHNNSGKKIHQIMREDYAAFQNNSLVSDTSISYVEVLVILDTELQGNVTELEEIESDFMTADFILQNSGINASENDSNGGVPLRLSMMGPQYMDIPDAFESIRITNFDGFDPLTSGTNPTSFELKQRLVNSGADYVAVFTDYLPTDENGGVCGKASIPNATNPETNFAVSVTMNSVHCNAGQYVLLHELVHSFGSVHDDRPASDEGAPYVNYARGMNIGASKKNTAFSTLMAGCGGPTDPDFDPASTTCDRIKKLSSPDDSFQGQDIGVIDFADNARFLTERRTSLANRQAINANIDFVPRVNITVPETSSGSINISISNSFDFDAEVIEDFDDYTTTWTVWKTEGSNDTEVDEEVITGTDVSFATDAFATVGDYTVSINVTDSSGQTQGETIFVNVVDTTNIPVIADVKAIFKNRYGIEIIGENFDPNAFVKIRENIPGSSTIEVFFGNLIYNRGDHPVLDAEMLRFPLVDPENQAIFRNNGLCFKVVNTTIEGNEICIARPPNVEPQGPFLGSEVESFSSNEDRQFDTYIVKDEGTVLKMYGNSWKKVAFNYELTTSSVLKFNFKSVEQEPEYIAVGFIMQDEPDGDIRDNAWQIYGFLNFGDQTYNNYSGTLERTYEIPVGRSLQGQISDIVFITNEDVRRGHSSVFINPMLSEQEIDTYDNVPLGRAYSDDAPGDAVPIIGGAAAQTHNFHDDGDGDWTIMFIPTGKGFNVRTTQLDTASAQMIAYRVDGAYSEISPGRWDITQSDLTHVADDFSTGNNSIILHNVTGSEQAYVVRTFSSGPFGNNTDYSIRAVVNDPEIDAYDNVPAQRAYSDDAPGDAVPIIGGGATQTHNFHDDGDGDWTIMFIPTGKGFNVRTTQLDTASAQMIAYRVDGAYSEVSPGRWDITQSDLTHVDDDFSTGNNSIILHNVTGSEQAYVVRTFSSGPFGNNTDYSIRAIVNNPETDVYDDVPAQRAYSDDAPGDAVPIIGGGATQTHNFHDDRDGDWTIMFIPTGKGFNVRTTQLDTASAQMIAYRVDGAYSEVSPGRWNITQSDLTHVDDDFSTGNNSIILHNVTGSEQAYVVRTFSSGPYGEDTDYTIRAIVNNPEVDAYDNVPAQRAYSDDAPGDAVPIAGGATAQTHNFHDDGDEDWTIFSMPTGSGFNVKTFQLGLASAQMIAYRVDGTYTEISPGRWDITQSDLTHVADDFSTGNNSILLQNTTGSNQAYVIRTFSSGPFGSNTDYSIVLTENNP
ncbi:zinc-dependent metalloprotease family protein [Marinicella sp. W31]|uniref:zinc-dependent metalloprotease family protein n=1 Tax=Marinicella sp. W31 TaxID=3023713 RepID=UPI0037579E73